MGTEIIREFYGTRVESTGSGSFVEIIAAADRDKESEGVLVVNTGASGSADLEVNDNNSDSDGWYSLPPGSTAFLPFAPIFGIFVRGATTYKLQQARLTA